MVSHVMLLLGLSICWLPTTYKFVIAEVNGHACVDFKSTHPIDGMF